MHLATSPVHLRVEGSPYDVGRQQGEAMLPMVQYSWRRVRQRFYNSDLGELTSRLKSLVSETERRFPEEIEEIRGIAAGSALDFYACFLLNRHLGADVGCTCLAFSDSTAGPIAGGNLDDDPVYFLKESHTPGQHSCIVVTWPGTIGCGQGMNEHGLAHVGTTAVPLIQRPAKRPRYLADKFSAGQRVLRRCKTVPEAVDFMMRSDVAGYGNMMFVDEHGNAACVEKYGHVLVGVRYPDDGGLLYAVNCFLSELTIEDASTRIEPRDKARIPVLEAARHELKERPHLALSDMMAILRNTEGGGGDWPISNSRTYMSTIMLPRRRELLATDGPPHVARSYARFSIGQRS